MFALLRLVSNYAFILLLFYNVLAKDLIDCPNGEQGDEKELPIICDANATKEVDCAVMLLFDSDDYHPINCVKIINQGNETDPDFIQISVGGVNYTYIFVDIFDEPTYGVNYTLSIWAIPINKSDTTLPPTTTTVETTPVQIETTTTEITTTTEKIETTTSGGSGNKFTSIFLILCMVSYFVVKLSFKY